MGQARGRLAVENERQLELYMEGQRWFDLVRNNRLLEVMQKHKDKDGRLLFAGLQAFPAVVADSSRERKIKTPI